MSVADLSEIQSLLNRGVKDEVFPGAQAAVASLTGPIQTWVAGRTRLDGKNAEIKIDTLFDLASVTKVLLTTTVAARLVSKRQISLDLLVAPFFPELHFHVAYENVRVRDLLAHQSGLPAWCDFALELRERGRIFPGSEEARAWILTRVASMAPAYVRGQKTIYSDLGFILLGEILSRISGVTLEELFKTQVMSACPTSKFVICPKKAGISREDIAATEDVPWRGGTIQGEVHDDNAFLLGGIAPHAGLFGTGAACIELARLWMGALDGDRSFLDPAVAREFVEPVPTPEGSPRALGWDLPSGPTSAAGTLVTPNSPGHLGYTGTSLWIDLRRKVAAVLLTNRVHPTAKNEKIKVFRPEFYDAVWRTWGA